MKLNWEDMKAFLIKNKTYVIIAAIFVVMIFTLVKVSSKDTNDKAEETNSEKVITVDETTTDATDTAAQTSND
ncbi:hypothetical protein CG709_02240 [Lachnotalea glycerini]|nr:hypothetical protein CG709_02240 [Lachnotalea glycerini]